MGAKCSRKAKKEMLERLADERVLGGGWRSLLEGEFDEVADKECLHH